MDGGIGEYFNGKIRGFGEKEENLENFEKGIRFICLKIVLFVSKFF